MPAPRFIWRDHACSKLQRSMIKLKLTFESPVFKEPRRLIWEASELSIGRSSRCDFVVPLPTLSSHHLTFRGREGRYEVMDVGSRNGTLLDEVRLEPEHFVPVRGGMVLRTIDLTIRVELTESYDAESFTMQTATQAIRHMAEDALQHEGQDQDAYLEVMDGPLRGRRFVLDDRLQQAFIGSGQGALIRVHDTQIPERLLTIDRTEQGFALTPADGERLLIDGQPVIQRYELRSRQRIVAGPLELYFFDPIEDLMLVLDGVLPEVERVLPDALPEESLGEQGNRTPEVSLDRLAQPVPEAVGEDDAARSTEQPAQNTSGKTSRLSRAEILIIVMIVLMVCAALGVMAIFVFS